MMIRLAGLLLFLLAAGQAFAYRMASNQPLDRALYAGHDPKVILAGRIVEKTVTKWPGDMAMFPGADTNIKFAVDEEIMSAEPMKGRVLDLSITAFMWPETLVPCRQGTFCIGIFRNDFDGKQQTLRLCTVVPAHNRQFRTAANGEDAKRILAAEILAELQAETSVSRQHKLIMQVAPILQAQEAGSIKPFLQSDDIWLHFAALATLLRATHEQQYADLAYREVEHFINTTDPARVFTYPKPNDGYISTGAYSFFFQHFCYLSVGWSREDDAAAAAYLPFFRLLAQHPRVPEGYRWSNGIEPLCRVGTREDALLLYRYCGNRTNAERQRILSLSYNRQAIILGLSRIFNLGLPNWAEQDFLKQEASQHQAVTAALIREGLMTEQDAHSHVPVVRR